MQEQDAFVSTFAFLEASKENKIGEIIEKYQDMVFNLSLGYLRSREEAEEVTQDVFVEVYHSLENFRSESSLQTWIYRITANKCLDRIRYYKRKKRFAVFTSLFGEKSGEELYPTHSFEHPGIRIENKELGKTLFQAISELPGRQQTAFLLSHVEHLKTREIAEIMESTEKTAESLIYRAKENLKIKLKNVYEGRVKTKK